MKPKFEVVVCNQTMVLILDHGCGTSVTNAAAEVVLKLDKQLENGIKGRRLIYRDTDGRFDEILHVQGRFTGFRALSDEQQPFFESVVARRKDGITVINRGNNV